MIDKMTEEHKAELRAIEKKYNVCIILFVDFFINYKTCMMSPLNGY